MSSLPLTQLGGGPGLDEVVDPGAAAADLGFGNRDQFEAGNALQERTRLLTDALGMSQVTGVVIDDPTRQRMAGRTRLTEFHDQLGHVTNASAEQAGPPGPDGIVS